jgi:hypothetical protein
MAPSGHGDGGSSAVKGKATKAKTKSIRLLHAPPPAPPATSQSQGADLWFFSYLEHFTDLVMY